MSDFGWYTGDEVFTKEFKQKDYLIDQILHERDSVILAGKPKTGKSILLFQLICALTSGQNFLEHFKVKRKCKVLYIQLEGTMEDSQLRFQSMTEALEMDNDNFMLLYSHPLALNDPDTTEKLIKSIETRMGAVDVIIIDPIYFAINGSLSDDNIVRQFTGQVRVLQDHFGAACILTHHFKKARRDQKGNILTTDDDDVFGSVFFQAWITHQFLFDIDRTSGTRILQCNIQRSGRIIEKLNLALVEPEPLMFKTIDHFPTKSECLKSYFLDNPGKKSSSTEIRKALNDMPRQTFHNEQKKLRVEGLIDREKIDNDFLYFLIQK